MGADTSARYYNIGTGKRTTIKELAELVLRLTGSNQKIRYEPQGQTFVKNRIGSTALAKADLGFEATVGLEAGLRELIAWRGAHKAEVAQRRARVDTDT